MSAEIPSEITSTDAPESQRISEESGRGSPGEIRKGLHKRINLPLLILILILAPVIAWQWYDTRNQIAGLQHELAKRLAEADASGKESRNIAGEAAETGRRAEMKLSLLEAKLAESQNQQLALEALYQELTRNRDEATLEEVEQLLLIANQQLQLAGNVKAALIAMQEADARLQRIDRPQLTPLRKILSKDMDRLKAAPYVDTVGISLRLDNLAAAVDKLPLAMELRPPEVSPPRHQALPGESLWLKFLRETWEDLKQLVRIQIMDKPDVALLSPSQAYFLRENLKLRLLSARHALLARDGPSFKADLDASIDWISRYYDNKSEPVVSMLEGLRTLRDSEVGVELPRISESLDAVRNYRLARDRNK
ncbi:uroporphyrinogen-III C-methyltransferase [Nitrosovibrio tenuis]|uniref:Uroporphyrin-3 C-methyltransferase n=1 Tax=Nitrosovibrio tenuis TaxID=1233 RepID=A0A1H7LE10_9PROT|nr:uroporphyrinogen-III C-methyltransferase [Nitrosovibrio tenuis]SEK97076.1 uroporphyrin-3 C-methyltransferase [Nitrosovibrio tenuis]